MRYYSTENSLTKPQRLVPFWLLMVAACVSSFGLFSRFLFSEGRSFERLFEYHTKKIFASSNEPMTPRAANLYVHSITTHTQGRELEIWENWIQWLLGQFYSPLLRTQNPRWIVSAGEGDCSERAAVLQDLLQCQGLTSRLIGLGGHVVLEVHHDQQTWILDPDYGISLPTGFEQLQTQPMHAIVDNLVEQGLAKETSIQYSKLIRSTHDNTALGWNEPLSPRLKRLEHWCELAVWVLPMFCWIFVGWCAFPTERF